MANVSWALAVETMYQRQLRDELALGVRRCMYEFKRKDCCTESLLGYQAIGNERYLLTNLGSVCKMCFLIKMSLKELVNTLWAFAVFSSTEVVD